MSVAQPLPISPGAVLDLSWDWSSWLQEGESVTAREVVAVAPLTKGADTLTGAVVTAMVTAPTTSEVALEYNLTARCTITTSAGRSDTRRFRLVLTDR